MADLTPKQELFMSCFFDKDSETYGDSIASCEAAGYGRNYHSQLLKLCREEIRGRTLDLVNSKAVKAVEQLDASMDENGKVPRGELRLKSAESVLDRMGIGKQVAIDITSSDESVSPLFVLPSKNEEIEVDPQYDGINLRDAD